jgi:hypothetical protein
MDIILTVGNKEYGYLIVLYIFLPQQCCNLWEIISISLFILPFFSKSTPRYEIRLESIRLVLLPLFSLGSGLETSGCNFLHKIVMCVTFTGCSSEI